MLPKPIASKGTGLVLRVSGGAERRVRHPRRDLARETSCSPVNEAMHSHVRKAHTRLRSA
eukprot:3643554-Pleurochrysis_carterae.AAC.6